MLQLLDSDSSSDEDTFIANRRPRVYQPRMEYLNSVDFRERFRLTLHQAELLLTIIGSQIETRSTVSTAMSACHKLLVTLRFYASNSFYYTIGDGQGLSLYVI
jgi:hypothetical protein